MFSYGEAHKVGISYFQRYINIFRLLYSLDPYAEGKIFFNTISELLLYDKAL